MNNLTPQEWLFKYISAEYTKKDKLLHNIPYKLDKFVNPDTYKENIKQTINYLKEFIKLGYLEEESKENIQNKINYLTKQGKIKLYRGLYFPNENYFKNWAKNEVNNFNTNKSTINLTTKSFSSWSYMKGEAERFALGGYYSHTGKYNISDNPISMILQTTVKPSDIYIDMDIALQNITLGDLSNEFLEDKNFQTPGGKSSARAYRIHKQENAGSANLSDAHSEVLLKPGRYHCNVLDFTNSDFEDLFYK